MFADRALVELLRAVEAAAAAAAAPGEPGEPGEPGDHESAAVRWFSDAVAAAGGAETLEEAAQGWRVWVAANDVALVSRQGEVLRKREPVARAVLAQGRQKVRRAATEAAEAAAAAAAAEAAAAAAAEAARRAAEGADLDADLDAGGKAQPLEPASAGCPPSPDARSGSGKPKKPASSSSGAAASSSNAAASYAHPDGSWAVSEEDVVAGPKSHEHRSYSRYWNSESGEYIGLGDCVLLATEEYMEHVVTRPNPKETDFPELRRLGFVGLVTAVRVTLNEPRELLVSVAWFWRKRDIVADCAKAKRPVPAELPPDSVADDWIAMWDHTDVNPGASILCSCPVIYAATVAEGVEAVRAHARNLRPFFCSHIYMANGKKLLEPVTAALARNIRMHPECLNALRRGLSPAPHGASAEAGAGKPAAAAAAASTAVAAPAPTAKRVRVAAEDPATEGVRPDPAPELVVKREPASEAGRPGAAPQGAKPDAAAEAPAALVAAAAGGAVAATRAQEAPAARPPASAAPPPAGTTSTPTAEARTQPSPDVRAAPGESTRAARAAAPADAPSKVAPSRGVVAAPPPAAEPASMGSAAKATEPRVRRPRASTARAEKAPGAGAPGASSASAAASAAASGAPRAGRAFPLVSLNPDPSMFDFLNPATWTWRTIEFDVPEGP